jgi:cob(I)alamin adenosyltransferase
MDPYARARAIDPDLFASYTGRYHLQEPTSTKPSKEEMESASYRLMDARDELAQLNEESKQELSRASLVSLRERSFEEVYKKHNEYEEVIIPEKEDEIRNIEEQYAWYRYEKALQEFKDHVEKYGRPFKKSKRGGMKRKRKTRR